MSTVCLQHPHSDPDLCKRQQHQDLRGRRYTSWWLPVSLARFWGRQGAGADRDQAALELSFITKLIGDGTLCFNSSYCLVFICFWSRVKVHMI